MPLKPTPYREVKRKLEAKGFRIVSQKGSHVKFAKETPEGLRVVIVPRHKEIAVGTLRSILRQAGLSPEEFELLLTPSIVHHLRSLRLKSFLSSRGRFTVGRFFSPALLLAA